VGEIVIKTAFLTLVAFVTLVAVSSYAQTSSSSPRVEEESVQDYFNPNLAAKVLAHGTTPEATQSHFLGIRIEPYQPMGQGFFADQSKYNLSNLGSTVMPTLSFGLLTQEESLGEFQSSYGLELRGAYATQSGTLTSTSGTGGDTKLQTTLISLNPLMRIQWRSKYKIYTRLQAEIGTEQINLTSSGSLNSSQRSSGFVGYGLGLEWVPFQNYGFVADYYSRTGTSADQSWTPTASSFQIGVLSFF
jgi:hypothetical protein